MVIEKKRQFSPTAEQNSKDGWNSHVNTRKLLVEIRWGGLADISSHGFLNGTQIPKNMWSSLKMGNATCSNIKLLLLQNLRCFVEINKIKKLYIFVILEVWFECKYWWKSTVSMSAYPCCGKDEDESDFFLKTLGEVLARISLLAYVKPGQKNTLYISSYCWSDQISPPLQVRMCKLTRIFKY